MVLLKCLEKNFTFAVEMSATLSQDPQQESTLTVQLCGMDYSFTTLSSPVSSGFETELQKFFFSTTLLCCTTLYKQFDCNIEIAQDFKLVEGVRDSTLLCCTTLYKQFDHNIEIAQDFKLVEGVRVRSQSLH